MNENNSIDWEKTYSTPDPWSIDSEVYEQEKLQKQLRYLPSNATILELGCGEGRTTQVFANSASSITAVDVSQTALNRAISKQYDCQVEFVESDVKTFEPSQQYDCVVLSEILYYLFEDDHEEMRQWIEKLQRHITPAGRIILTSVLTNPEDDIRGNRKRLLKRYRMHRAFAQSNFQCLHEEVGSGVKNSDKYQHYLISVFGRSDHHTHLNPAWNNHIVPTWDDGPDFIFGNEHTLKCIDDLIKKQVRKFRLFWTGAHLLSADMRHALGIQLDTPTGNSVSTIYEPGKWPASLLNSESIDPAVSDLCQEIKEKLLSADIPLNDVIGFHGITHPPYDHSSHLQFQPADVIAGDINFFQQICRQAFNEPDFLVRYGRPPHGAGFPLHEGRADHVAEYVKAASSLPQSFQWKLWRTSSKDWRKKWNATDLAAEAWQDALMQPKHSWDYPENEVLFHSRYYAETQEEFNRFLDALNG